MCGREVDSVDCIAGDFASKARCVAIVWSTNLLVSDELLPPDSEDYGREVSPSSGLSMELRPSPSLL